MPNYKKLNDKVSIYTPSGVSAEPIVRALGKSENTTSTRRSSSGRKSSTKKAGAVIKSNNKGFVGNIQKGFNKHLAKTVGLAAIGSLSYVLVPTVLQKVVNKDLSGWKGFLLGVGSVSLVGLGLNKPEITIGALAAAGTHILYSKGTKAVYDITGVPLFTMANPTKPETQANLSDNADDVEEILPLGATWEYINGEKTAVFPTVPARYNLPPSQVVAPEEAPIRSLDNLSLPNYELDMIINKRRPNSGKNKHFIH